MDELVCTVSRDKGGCPDHFLLNLVNAMRNEFYSREISKALLLTPRLEKKAKFSRWMRLTRYIIKLRFKFAWERSETKVTLSLIVICKVLQDLLN